MDNIEAEVLFAQKLADCDPGIRKKTFSRLRQWISSRMKANENFDRTDLITLWKGLYYCMWLQDKPLLHEELADRLCQLADEFSDPDQFLLYADTFLETMGREWFSLDKWRVDKFMMLFRRMFRRTLNCLKSNDWDEDSWQRLSEIYSRTVWATAFDAYSEELKCHFASVYLDELDGAGVFEESQELIFRFLNVYVKLLTSKISDLFFRSIVSEIFDSIMVDFSENIRIKSSKKRKRGKYEAVPNSAGSDTKIDYGALADALFEAGKAKTLPNRRRAVIYKLAKEYRAAANGEDPFDEHIELGEDIDDAEVEKAARRLLKSSIKGPKKKRKRNQDEDADQISDVQSDDEKPAESSDAKSKRKSMKKRNKHKVQCE